MSGILQILLGGSQAPAVDPYFYSVTSLLHGDGTNGGQNNTFLDSSTNNFTITRNGNTTQGSFSPFSQTGWSNYFDGSGDFITAPSNAAFALSGDFSMECWAYFAGATAVGGGPSGELLYAADVTGGAVICVRSGTLIALSAKSVADDLSASVTFTPGQWYHLVAARTGTTAVLYVNGTRVATGTVSRSYAQGGFSTQSGFNGYLSNVRIVKGSNPYGTGTTITVPTAPLTAISGTSILTCQANRFLDASSNNFTITRNGDVSVQPFSPFNPTTAYSTSAVGGSGYFDGSGDYLDTATSSSAFAIGTGQFTVEAWVYTTDTSWALVSSTTSGGLVFGYNIDNGSQGLGIWRAGVGSAVTSGVQIPYGAWTHIAVSRDGSNNVRLYANGVQIGSTTSNTTDFGTGNQVFRVGADGIAPASFIFTGYAASVRVIKGAAQYTGTTYTVPTSPLEAVANTSLLLNFTNGAIFDNAAVADYETVGNAQISTSVKKYGTGSMAFDGSGDRLYAPSNQAWNFGTGDFTIELWVYPTAQGGHGSSNNDCLIDFRPGSNGVYGTLYIFNNGTGVYWFVNSANRITGAAIPNNQWTHVALCRTASQTKLFINGTQSGATYSDTNSYLVSPIMIGEFNDGVGGGNFQGYIDDVRISKGIARYPYNFTPPTAEFPNIGGTVTLTADPYFDYTTLLLPGNGTNGAQNNTFLDSSTNNFSITRNGNTTQGTFSPFSQTGWGNYFDGSGDYLTAPSNAAFNISTGDYTFECWVYKQTSSRVMLVAIASAGLSIAINTSGNIEICRSLIAIDFTFTAGVPNNQWTHIAVARSGTSLQAFMNGTSLGTQTSSTSYGQGTCFIGIDADGSSSPYLGYISNARLVKGTAVYTANFTPSTTPLTAISGTSLLTCQSNRFIDNGPNAFAITRNGDVSVQAFSPFNPTAAWSAATNGGSGYFDGSGDYLQVAASANQDFGSSAFTVEFWWYSVPNSGRQWFYAASTDYWFGIDVQDGAGGLGIWASSNGSSWDLINSDPGGNGRSGVQPQRQAWNHIVVGRSSGTWSVWLNGTRVLNLTGITGAIVSRSAQAKVVGGWAGGSQYLVNGYLSNFRVVIGTDVYGVSNSTITVPTAPLTAITNTQILLNTTNAGIYDATSKNDLETVGNAQISTTQSKFGGSSMYFDGTGDWLAIPATQNIVFGTADFTIEMWVYSGAQSGTGVRMMGNGAGGSWASGKYVITTTSGTAPNKFIFAVNNASPVDVLVSTTTFNDSTWRHVAITRYGNVFRLFVNGIQESTTTTSISVDNGTAAQIRIGSGGISGDADWAGYIDDLRITKGIARYTSNFIPPSTPFLTL